jgi:Trk-type K+ transport system membrane component
MNTILKARRIAAVALALAATGLVAETASASSVHSIGGYVFYNVSYAEAVDMYFAAVAAAPAGYTPPPVYSVSTTTTVSGTVEGP